MPQDQAFNGRVEKRLPIIVVVRLAHLERTSNNGIEEWTYTDNISARGARVFSRRFWPLGEEITVTPYEEEPTCGSVVYCERLADGRYFIGVKFKDHPVTWSAIRRYGGIQISVLAKSTSS